jgi:hypothetical protein
MTAHRDITGWNTLPRLSLNMTSRTAYGIDDEPANCTLMCTAVRRPGNCSAARGYESIPNLTASGHLSASTSTSTRRVQPALLMRVARAKSRCFQQTPSYSGFGTGRCSHYDKFNSLTGLPALLLRQHAKI